MFVEAGGIPQWLEIEGEEHKPVLLLVHGGPGASTRFASRAWAPWREHFRLVHWDQRGTGRTYLENGPERSRPMSFDQIVDDGLEITVFLREHLAADRIIVLGHSWGSALAVHMVKREPDLFSALACTGLLVNFSENEALNYAKLKRLAKQRDDSEAQAILDRIGHPPYHDIQDLGAIRALGDKLLAAPGDNVQARPPRPPAKLTMEDRKVGLEALLFSHNTLISDLWRVDIRHLGAKFEVPVLVVMGTHDQQTPIELARSYFEAIEAPRKAFVAFEGCHHFVHFNRPEEFLEHMLKHL